MSGERAFSLPLAHLFGTIFDVFGGRGRAILTFVRIPLVNHATRAARGASSAAVARPERGRLLFRLRNAELGFDDPLCRHLVAALGFITFRSHFQCRPTEP